MKRNLHLLIIDPQNDFCDLPANYRPTTGQFPANSPTRENPPGIMPGTWLRT